MKVLWKFLKDPLVHFIVLGGLLFAGFRIAKGSLNGEDIIVSRGQVEQLRLGFTRSWLRPPTDLELKALVEDHIREEVFVREALELKLGENDVIVRRRLRQKLEFILEDAETISEPSEANLLRFYEEQHKISEDETAISFIQIYFDINKHNSQLDTTMASALKELRAGTLSPDNLGDPLLIGDHFELVASSEIRKQWGDAFAKELLKAALGQWQGPIESPYGKHLVFVEERKKNLKPNFTEIKEQVRKDYFERERLAAQKRRYESLRSRYRVVIEDEN